MDHIVVDLVVVGDFGGSPESRFSDFPAADSPALEDCQPLDNQPLSVIFWSLAACWVVYVLQRMPTSALEGNKSPWEERFGYRAEHRPHSNVGMSMLVVGAAGEAAEGG